MSIILATVWSWTNTWTDAELLQDELINIAYPVLEAATPDAAAYNNEGNWQQADWQDTFYGSNYERLLGIKQMYDPGNVFYGLTSVGSESWAEDAEGRLCPTSSS